MEITGKVQIMGTTKSIPCKDGSQLQKRELILDTTRYDSMTGEKLRDNLIGLEFIGERCALIDQFKVGQIVKVKFDIQGRLLEKDGEVLYFNSLRGYSIEAVKIPSQPTVTPVEPTAKQGSLPF